MEFINADLEITSQEGLEPIKDAFAQYGDRFFELYCGETEPGFYLATFEIHPDEDRDDQTAEEKIHAFCDSITELRGLAHDRWVHATRRVIDLGYQTDDNCEAFKDCISAEALRRLETLGIDLALTIYPQKIQPQNKPLVASGDNAPV
jgi:hypothetical protein